ncbi:MAG: amidophosphoribosyltransferase [Clostridiales bacterium]|nr:amidophosphoribosyltransferase [Clostridiales bacterium]
MSTYNVEETSCSKKLHEECGVFGIYSENAEVLSESYRAMYALQHRGQESCGIAVNHAGVITGYKDVGLVNEVFTSDVMKALPNGKMAIAHCRYGPAKTATRNNAQPLVINHLKGNLAICYNGSLMNTSSLRESFELSGGIFHSATAVEVMAYTITKERLQSPSIEEAIKRAMDTLQGAYSMVLMSSQKLIALRDPYGFRPLCLGKIDDGYVVASESCAFDAIGATFLRDVKPGEILIISKEGLTSIQTKAAEKSAFCVFEFIYFARSDSVIENASVHGARLRAGAFLALEHPVQADVVIGVPDSGIDAAIGYARQSGIQYGQGFVKNRYIGRTFIQPSQKQRQNAIKIKLNVIASTVKDKRVVLVDDSIVRGNTSKIIVHLLKEAGAKEVHLRLSSPPFLYPCYYGTDIDSSEHLLAYNHTMEEMRELIGVDSIGFLSTGAVGKLAENASCTFCDACFTGNYPIQPLSMEQKPFKYAQELNQ